MGRSLSDRPLYVGFQGLAVVARALADTGAVAFDPRRTSTTDSTLKQNTTFISVTWYDVVVA